MGALFAALFGAIGITGTGATILTAIAGIGASLGLSFLAGKLRPKQATAPVVSGVESTVRYGGVIPREVAFGRVVTAGHLVYVNTWGETNQNLQAVFVLSDGWCDTVESIFFQGGERALLAGTPSGNELTHYTVADTLGALIVRWFDGRPGQAADTELVAHANPAGRWTASETLTGLAYVTVEAVYDPTIFPGGVEDILSGLRFVVRGARLYDWRKDSTNGGSGAHRWDDPATWEWSLNPAVIRYNYQRGIWTAGQLICGQGLPVSDLLHGLYTAAANICDEAVALDAGGTEIRYRAAAIVRNGVPHRDVVDELDQCMAGFGVERQGAFGPIAGAAYAVVATFTDGDLISGEEVTWSGKRSRSELFNAVFGTFLDPRNAWNENSYPPLLDAGLEAADGGERLSLQLDLPAVPSGTQAQRIAKIRRAEVRSQKNAAVVLGFEWVWLEAGDWITWNSDLYGLATYRIVRREIDQATRRVRLQLEETSAAVYDWGTADEGPVALPGDPHAPGTRPQTVASFAVQADTIASPSGEMLPALVFSWTPPNDATVDRVIVEFGPTDTDATPPVAVTRLSDDTPEDGELVFAPVLPGRNYGARATIRTTPPRQTAYTDWVYLDTDTNLVASTVRDLGITFAKLEGQLRSEIDLITNDAAGSLSDLTQRANRLLERISADALLTALSAYDRHRGTIVANAQSRALIAEEVTLRATADEALASRLDLVEADVGENAAAITTEVTARATADAAQATLITAAQARADEATASGLIKLDTSAGPSGAAASFGVFLRAALAGSYDAAAAFLLQILSGGGTRAVFDVDQFMVWDGSTSQLIFAISGGQVFMTDVFVNRLVAGTVETTHLVDGNVTTAKVAANAITQVPYAFSAGAVATNQKQALAITRTGSTAAILAFSCNVETQSIAAFCTVRFLRNGATLREIRYVPLALNGSGTYAAAISMPYVDQDNVAGTVTYSVEVVLCSLPSQAYAESAATANSRLLSILETKR